LSFIAELRRRHVFKVGGAYLVIAWLAVQAASIGFPAFDAPPWVLRVFILVSLLGFPIAVVMAWIYEVTPDGVKTDASGQGSKRVFAAVAVLIVLALGWYFYGQPSFRKGDAQTPMAALATDPNSIAVLPFANISGKADEEYFSDGMTEELLNVLAKVPQLKVVARTSVFQFKGKGGDVREIGRTLGVTHIVEGSVRRDGQQVRVTAQLIRVSDGIHVWSETYARKLEGVFALQDDIARHISAALKQSLGVAAPVTARAAVDPEAYDEYLKGRALLRSRSDLPGAIKHLKAAVAKAPDFAAGWSSLSLAYDVSYWWVPMDKRQAAEALNQAAIAADKAAVLEPNSASTDHALANVLRAQFKYSDAEQHYLRAMQLDPSYPDAREDYSELLYYVGRVDDSLLATHQLVTLDPFFAVGWARKSQNAVALDNRVDFDESLRRVRAIAPNSFQSKYSSIDYALAYKRAAEAHAALAVTAAKWPEDAKFATQLLPWALGEKDLETNALNAAIMAAPSGEAIYYLIARPDIPAINAYRENGGAILQGYYFIDIYRSKPMAQTLLRDPRVKAKLIEYGFVAYWREKGWPKGCRPLDESDFECGLDAMKAP